MQTESTRVSRGRLVAWVCAFTLSFSALPRSAIAVADVQCGMTYRGAGQLTRDLVCDGLSGGIRIEYDGSLLLNGFTLTGDVLCAAVRCSSPSLQCGGDCQIVGPGTIHGEVTAYRSLGVSDVAFVGTPTETAGVTGGMRVRVERSTFLDSPTTCAISNFTDTSFGASVSLIESVVERMMCGITANSRVNVKDSRIVDSMTYGVLGGSRKTALKSSEVSGSGTYGVSGEQVLVLDSTIADNGEEGVISQDRNGEGVVRANVKRSTVVRNRIGVSAKGTYDNPRLGSVPVTALISQSDVTDNTMVGATSQRGWVRLVQSNVTANGSDAECGATAACSDVEAGEQPTVSNSSSCGTSHVTDSGIPGETWSVCTSD